MRHRSARSAALLAAALLAAGGCGGGDEREPREPRDRPGTPTSTDRLPGDSDSRGAQVAATSGCLACHRLGALGHDGPGTDLSRIGAKLPASAIERALLAPAPPMPSFRELPAADRRALVRYLASLR